MPDRLDHSNRPDIKDWLQNTVAREVEECRSAEITADHVSETQKGVLAWFAEHFVNADPVDLIFCDGSSDGGMDIVSITTSESSNHVTIYQCNAPRIDKIVQGQISTKRTKYSDDVRHLLKTLAGRSKRLKELNPTAQNVLRQINQMRDLAEQEEDTVPLTIEVRPLALRLIHPETKDEISALKVEAEKLGHPNERWFIRDVEDIESLYTKYRRKISQADAPEELRFAIVGEVARDHAERGPFLCFAKADDLIKAYEKWGASILDANLRYSLGKSDVNKLIEAELEKASAVKWFHEKNNGLVLTCDSCHSTKGGIRVTAPQIINGGQTIHSITTVVRQIESKPRAERDQEEQRVLDAIRTDLKLPTRIVVVSGGKATRSDDIALASNTQNKLSDRTMRSSSLAMRNLRLKLAGGERPWYVVTKDGEWSAVSKRPRLFQSKTGNRNLNDFKVGRKYRTVDNTDLGVALLAFLGFVDAAKPSRVFKSFYFDNLFNFRPTYAAWKTLTTRKVEWRGQEYLEVFEPGQAQPHQWLLAYVLLSFWRTYTYPESKQLLMAYEEAGKRDSGFSSKYYKNSGWDVTPEAQAELLKGSDSCYWREQIAKSAYLVMVYQSMRILHRCFGALDDETCMKILQLRQFSVLNDGQPIDSLGDFRAGSFSDGALTCLGRILLYACELLWQSHDARIRPMASRQQTLLQGEWVGRLSEKTDLVCDRLKQPSFRQVVDGVESGVAFATVEELFRIQVEARYQS